jgi:hypothetical protein
VSTNHGSWGVENLDDDVTERKYVPIANRTESWQCLGLVEKDILRPGRLCEVPPSRDVVCVDVSVNDVEDLHPGVPRRIDIDPDVAHRVDDRAGGLPTAAKQVGNANRVRMQELAQYHAYLQRHPVDRLRWQTLTDGVTRHSISS